MFPVAWSNVSLTAQHGKLLKEASEAAVTSNVSGYEGFGSFHSENVEDLIAQSEKEYKKPSLPIFAETILSKNKISLFKREFLAAQANEIDDCMNAGECSENGRKRPRTDDNPKKRFLDIFSTTEFFKNIFQDENEKVKMGADFREKHFTIADNVTFINHGAFGSALAGSVLIKHLFEYMLEDEVVEFVDRHLLPLIVYTVRLLAKFIRANPTQVVLLQNATFGLNSAMRIIDKNDVVAFLDTEYLSVYKMLYYRCKEVDASLHEIYILKYIHDERVMGDDETLSREICSQLPKGCTAIVIDYVTSTTAFCLPVFSHLIRQLRQRGVQKIIVDGAHAPLQLDLDFDSLSPECQPTIFVGNLHKWFSLPKAAGFMWVHKESVDSIHSVVLSHGAGDGILSEFIWDGTRDYGAYLAIPATIHFWEKQDVRLVRQYCCQLLESSVTMLTEAFKSRRVARSSPFMSLVELPEGLQDPLITAKHIQDILHDVYNIEVPVKRVEGKFYVRISAFVYNVPEEYAFLREAILSMTEKWINSAARHKLTEREKSTDSEALPCDERIRRQGGCGVSGLDPSSKPKKTKKFK